MELAYIAILNWNSSDDTIECLESVLRSDHPRYRVVVCDNGSSDGSMERIKGWAEGRVSFSGARLPAFSFPPLPKPVPYREYDRAAAEAGGEPDDDSVPLILVQAGSNLGYAGGNNVIMRYALSRDDFGHLWILNNDTVVAADALNRLVLRLQEVPGAGMCGSTLPYYDDPSRIWAQGGGTLNRWLAKSACIGNGRLVGNALPAARVERKLGYIAGASLLVSRQFLQEIGLLSEEYFLYYEEPDWAMRARGAYTMAYAPQSVVYHKVGVSTELLNIQAGRSKPTDRYIFRNALVFTRKFFPAALPLVFARVSLQRLRRHMFNTIRSWCSRL